MEGRLSAIAVSMVAIFSRFMLIRYLLASIIALSSDMLLFLALIGFHLHPAAAAFAGYVVGIFVHWLISVRFVFLSAESATHMQRIGFILSAVVGMGVTLVIVSGATAAGVAPAVAKLLAIPVSFLTVYAIRKYGVFASA